MDPAAVSPGWRKSSHSANGGTQCVEAGRTSSAILVRDTAQHGTGPVLRLTPAAWARLTTALRTLT
jgi:hypothetical protein